MTRPALRIGLVLAAATRLRHSMAPEEGRPRSPDRSRATQDVAHREQTAWAVQASPTLQLVLLLVTAVAVYLSLNTRVPRTGLADTREWQLWCAVASLGLATTVVFAYRGVCALRQLPWPVDALPLRSKVLYTAAAVALAGTLMGYMVWANNSTRDWPIPDMGLKLRLVSAAGALVSIPWLVLILVIQRALHSWASNLGTMRSGRSSDVRLGNYMQLWDLLASCIMAFGVLVSLALFPTGALRALWKAHAGDSEELSQVFPSTDVLLYGGFFAVALAALTVPVLALWRDTGRALIDIVVPLLTTDSITDEWAKRRELLESLLHLDVGPLRHPLTAFSILAPLVTSALAAFVPELAQ